MTTQVDNGRTYLSRYCGPDVPYRLRVEVRRQRMEYEINEPSALADVTWEQFKDIVRLGQQLIDKCNKEL